MLLAALVSLLVAPGVLLAALRGSGLGTLDLTVVWGLGSCETNGFALVLGLGSCETIGFTLVWGPGSCETTGFTIVWSAPGREGTWTYRCSGAGFGGQGGGL